MWKMWIFVAKLFVEHKTELLILLLIYCNVGLSNYLIVGSENFVKIVKVSL